jgi:membrane-associated phospholipid phosphatase
MGLTHRGRAPTIQPMRTQRFHWWPVLFIGMLAFYILLMIPALGNAFLRVDRAGAVFLNDLVGKSPLLDNFVVSVNTDDGDRTVFVFFAFFFIVHSIWRPSRDEVARRLAFWTWVAIMFACAYLIQEAAEDLFSRDSPGKVIRPWNNMRHMYDRDIKVSSSNSFPSGHATAYWFCAFMALPVYRRVGGVLLAVAIVVPTLRVMTGAHWPSDVWLGSAPLALFVAVLSYETRLRRIRDAFAAMYRRAIALFLDRTHAPLSRRWSAAWAAFMRPELIRRDEDKPDCG